VARVTKKDERQLDHRSQQTASADPIADHLALLSHRLPSLRGGFELARALHKNPDVLAASIAINLLSLALPIFLLQIYDRIIPNQGFSTLTFFAIGFFCVLVVDSILTLSRAYITGWSGAKLHHAISCAAMDRMLSSEVQAFEANAPGIQLQRLRAIETLRGFYSGQAALLWIDLPFAALFLSLIAVIGGTLVALPIIIMAATAGAAIWCGRNLHAALEDRTGNDNRRYNFIIDVLSKIPTVKAIGTESLMVRRYERLQGHSAAATYRSTFYSSMARSAGAMSSQIMMAAVAAYGSTMVIDGSLSIGSLAACTLLAGRAARPLLRLLGVWTQYQNVQIARRQITEVFALPLEYDYAPNDSVPRSETDAAAAAKPVSIEMSDVDFRYDSNKSDLLFNDLTLNVKPGEIIGITGSNGAGKSAFLHLISGILKPEKGVIKVDGKDIRTDDPTLLRSQICYLPQSGTLFEGTILENLTMFQVEDRLAKAFEIATRLGLTDVIARLPEGYDTKVSNGPEDGLPVSIKQRLAIARSLALVDHPRIILFDEANALLDPQSDLQLVDLLREYRGSATMVLISHRPKVLDLADRVYSIHNGQMVEMKVGGQGQHQSPSKGPAK